LPVFRSLTDTSTRSTPVSSVAEPDMARLPAGLGRLLPLAGLTIALLGLALIPPPRPKAYRKPSPLPMNTRPPDTAGELKMNSPVA
jgi:hypothetical protein